MASRDEKTRERRTGSQAAQYGQSQEASYQAANALQPTGSSRYTTTSKRQGQPYDLLRLYAREQAARQRTAPERAAALGRVLGLYAATAWHTMTLLRPADPRLARADDRWTSGGLEFADATAALDWLEAERANLLAAIRQAAATPGVPGAIAIQLAHALFGLFSLRSHWQDWVQVNQTALAIARQLSDRAAQAQVQADLGFARCWQGRYAESVTYTRESLAVRRALGDRRCQAISLANLGNVHERQGRYQEALAGLRDSLAIFGELGDRDGQAYCLTDLGIAHQRQAATRTRSPAWRRAWPSAGSWSTPTGRPTASVRWG